MCTFADEISIKYILIFIMWYNQSNALTAWRLGGTVVRRTAMTLAVMMLTAMTAPSSVHASA